MNGPDLLQIIGGLLGLQLFVWGLMLLIIKSSVRSETKKELEKVYTQVEERLKIATFEQWQTWRNELAAQVQKGVDEKLDAIKQSLAEMKDAREKK